MVTEQRESRVFPPLLVVGLTGGIASGKSTAARMFAELGMTTLSADDEGREVVAPGEPALAEVVAAFGKEYLRQDGTLDRRALGERVFTDSKELAVLNRITHGRILERVCIKLRKLAEGTREPQVVILEAAILVEAGWTGVVDKILVVTAQQSTQVARLMAGLKLTREQAEARTRSQLPLRHRLRHADFRIDGEAPIAEMFAQVKALRMELARLAGLPPAPRSQDLECETSQSTAKIGKDCGRPSPNDRRGGGK